MPLPALPPIETILAIVIVIFFAIGLHEYAHCKFADMAGDPTPGIYGRVTLNLTKHFEPMGTFMMILSSMTGVGIGWGRAAPINPSKMRNPRWDTFAAVAAGPISNVLQALIYAVALRFAMSSGAVTLDSLFDALNRDHTTFLAAFLGMGVLLNLGLAVFNLVPIGPLDGHWLVAAFLPEKQGILWNQWHRKYGRQILLVLIFLPTFTQGQIDPIGKLTTTPLLKLFSLFTGVPVA
jgi:Zn-dependent protease